MRDCPFQRRLGVIYDVRSSSFKFDTKRDGLFCCFFRTCMETSVWRNFYEGHQIALPGSELEEDKEREPIEPDFYSLRGRDYDILSQ